MIRTLIRKEIQEKIYSTQFVIIVLLCIMLIPTVFAQDQSFPDGLCIVCKYDHAEKITNKKKSPKHNQVRSVDGETIAYVNYRCGVTNANGETIIPEKYIVIIRNRDIFEVRQQNGLCGLIDHQGNEITPCIYKYLNSMPEGLYKVKKGGRFGMIDEKGNELIPCKYDYIGNLENGTVRVKKHHHWGVINVLGNVIVPCKYDIVENRGKVYHVREAGKWGVLDSTGNVLIPNKYDLLGNFENGFSRVVKDNNWGMMNQDYQPVTDFKYAYINPFKDGVAEACDCDEIVQFNNKLTRKRYESKGYVELKTPVRLNVMCKNPRYSVIKIED